MYSTLLIHTLVEITIRKRIHVKKLSFYFISRTKLTGCEKYQQHFIRVDPKQQDFFGEKEQFSFSRNSHFLEILWLFFNNSNNNSDEIMNSYWVTYQGETLKYVAMDVNNSRTSYVLPIGSGVILSGVLPIGSGVII